MCSEIVVRAQNYIQYHERKYRCTYIHPFAISPSSLLIRDSIWLINYNDIRRCWCQSVQKLDLVQYIITDKLETASHDY